MQDLRAKTIGVRIVNVTMKLIDIGAAPQALGGHSRSGEPRLGGTQMANVMCQNLSSRNLKSSHQLWGPTSVSGLGFIKANPGK